MLVCLRRRARLSQEELAHTAGLSVRAINNIERGRVDRPQRETVNRLAHGLGLEPVEEERFRALARRGPDHDGAQTLAAVIPMPGSGPARIEHLTAPAHLTAVVPAQLPVRDAHFLGRDRELRWLDSIVAGGGGGRRQVAMILGGPGLGKTALAVRWAYRARRYFPDGQLHLDLKGSAGNRPVSPHDALERCLRALGVHPQRLPSGMEEAAALYRTMLADRRVLVVLDDAAATEQVRPLIPGGDGCFVLVTSRAPLPGLIAQEGGLQLRLDGLSHEDSAALLARVAGDWVHAEPQAAVDLVNTCRGLPLALRAAAIGLSSTGSTRTAS
jgi:DNA-binding XRE family transcriptional regulator